MKGYSYGGERKEEGLVFLKRVRGFFTLFFFKKRYLFSFIVERIFIDELVYLL